MRLTRAGEYAVRCILYLSKKGSGELVSRQEIADQCDIPGHFLAKIAQQLAKAHIIEILQGAKGGYQLIKKPEEITLLNVIEVIIGEIFLNDCVIRPESCHASLDCAVNRVWIRARNELRRILQEVTFADLAAEDGCCVVRNLGELSAASPCKGCS